MISSCFSVCCLVRMKKMRRQKIFFFCSKWLNTFWCKENINILCTFQDFFLKRFKLFVCCKNAQFLSLTTYEHRIKLFVYKLQENMLSFLWKKNVLKIPFPLPLSLPEANSGFVVVVVVVAVVVVLQYKGEKKKISLYCILVFLVVFILLLWPLKFWSHSARHLLWSLWG